MKEISKQQYYRFSAKLTRGQIVQYLEFTDGWASRQVDEFPDRHEWFFCGLESSKLDRLRMCDQPLSAINVKEEHTIDRAEFERAWESANNWKIANALAKV